MTQACWFSLQIFISAFLKGIPMPRADLTPHPYSKWLTLLSHPPADEKIQRCFCGMSEGSVMPQHGPCTAVSPIPPHFPGILVNVLDHRALGSQSSRPALTSSHSQLCPSMPETQSPLTFARRWPAQAQMSNAAVVFRGPWWWNQYCSGITAIAFPLGPGQLPNDLLWPPPSFCFHCFFLSSTPYSHTPLFWEETLLLPSLLQYRTPKNLLACMPSYFLMSRCIFHVCMYLECTQVSIHLHCSQG